MMVDLNEKELVTLAKLLVTERWDKGDKSAEGESLELKLTEALLKETGHLSHSFTIQTKATALQALNDEQRFREEQK